MVDLIAMDVQTVMIIHLIRMMTMMDCVHFTDQTGDHVKYNECIYTRLITLFELDGVSVLIDVKEKRARKLQCYLKYKTNPYYSVFFILFLV